LITKLKPNLYNEEKGDELDIECTASINIAKTHARWCPVSKCVYFNVIDEEKAAKKLQELLKDQDNEQKIIIERKFNTLDKDRCFMTNKYDEPSEFQFEIETECRLRPTYLIFKGLSILEDKIGRLIKNLKDNKIPIASVNKSVANFYELQIKGEDFTLLNSIQCLIYNYNFRENPNNILEYIGYNQTHPLDNVMILKLKFITETDVSEYLIKNLEIIKEIISNLTKEWISISKLNTEHIIDVDKY
jgi:DNA-directed RNA polymerase subunit L